MTHKLHVGVTLATTRIVAAMGSGSVDNVMHPSEAPGGVEVMANADDKHFVRANKNHARPPPKLSADGP